MLGPKTGYLDALEIVTRDKIEQDAEASKKRNPLRPSSAGACTRQLAYQMMEHLGKAYYDTAVFTSEVHRLLSLGNSVEYHVIRQLDLLKEEFAIRYKQQALDFGRIVSTVDPTYSQTIEGSIDLVLWSTKHKAVMDIKSKKDWTFGWKNGWTETTEKFKNMKSMVRISDSDLAFYVDDLAAFIEELGPKESFLAANFYQLNMYANSQFLLDRGIDHGVIIQYNKNTSQMREIRFKPSAEVYQKTLKKFQIAMDAGTAGDPTLAPRDYEKSSKACGYCRYKPVCWKKEPTQVRTKEEDEMAFKEVKTGNYEETTRVVFEDEGDSVEGVFKEKVVINKDGDSFNKYVIQCGSELKSFLGAYQLDQAFSTIAPGTLVRVTYKGKTKIKGGKTVRKYEVLADDSTAA